MKNLPNIGLPIILLALFLIVFISRSSVNIGSGQAGVLFKTIGGGVVTDAPPIGEGFKIIAPWNRVITYNVRQQEALERMQVLSSNGLEISLDISILYQPLYDELGLLHQTKGQNYLNSVLLPNIRAVARSVVGRYTPEQLYSTKRDEFQTRIYNSIEKDFKSRGLILEQLLIDKGYISESGNVLGASGSNAGSSNPLVVPVKDAQAIWNYKTLQEDNSQGMHNPKYTDALLKNSIEYLQQ